MRRRGAGLAGIKKNLERQEAYQEVGNKIQSDSLKHVMVSMEKFKGSLEDFARKYRGKVFKINLISIQFVYLFVSFLEF